MNILVAIEDLRTGGAQIFGMRLAQALHDQGHKVYLYSHYSSYINYPLVQQIAPDVAVIAFTPALPGLDWLTRKAQGLFRRFGRPFPVREALVERHLRQTLEQLKIDVLNSHMIKSDYVAAAAATKSHPAVPLVISMHGCYEDFLYKESEPEVILHSKQALQQASGVVYLTEKNLEIFSVPGVRPLSNLPHVQIYNGFAGKFSAPDQLPTRAQLDIEEHDIVFGMVARGIPEKGWHYAVQSFNEVSQHFPQAHLILVGDSAYLDELRESTSNSKVHFVGFVPNPIDWVRLFDVGLLPSYFASESLPNSIAEYLFCSVPVIATHIGEVPKMLAVPTGGIAGVLLDQNGNGLTEPAALTAAIQEYLTNQPLLAAHRALAAQCFEKFRMAHCVAAYEEFFDKAQYSGKAIATA
ncbi:glycosyltransferase [Hymenobacter sp. HMF4947]|uniref:Glycosyltransferase n=1 Tax=Hymenobacter ginkgonis TaxID=2682976 RepID=A0A7K1TKP4_9BACT|nr:glycosyltransferase family 4 protein [Hymenobacter ginkgonis]MVN78989.1 glycosyltransferase [Hymenobacter ginkgonis]